MAKKLSARDKIESTFCDPSLGETEARHLLDLVGVIVRSRFPGNAPAKRGRKTTAKPVPPINSNALAIGDKHQ